MSLLAYSFASGIMLLTLAAVYMLMMRNTTHFGLNRACLILILTVSLIVPFISLPSLSDGVTTVVAGGLTITRVSDGTPIASHSYSIIHMA